MDNRFVLPLCAQNFAVTKKAQALNREESCQPEIE